MTSWLAAWTLPLFWLAPSVVWAQSPSPSAPVMCRVLEAAYTAATDSKLSAYPIEIRPEGDRLGKHVLSGLDRKALKAGEYNDLKSREAMYNSTGFQPHCQSGVTPTPAKGSDGHMVTISFTDPIFSTNGRLAVLIVSFSEAPSSAFGYGKLCIARLEGKVWSARCENNWVS